MFSINEVVRIIVEDNGVAITKNKVQDVMRRNLVTIERAREEFRNKVNEDNFYQVYKYKKETNSIGITKYIFVPKEGKKFFIPKEIMEGK